MSLLDELRALKPKLPQIKAQVPEWEREVTLQGLTVRQVRELQEGLRTEKNPRDADTFAIRALANAIVDEDGNRALANDEGIALIETLSGVTVNRLMERYSEMNKVATLEGNSGPRTDGEDLSSDSPSPSAEPSMSSKRPSARPN